MSNAYFGDYLAITNLVADPLGHISSYSYMRYEEAKLDIKLQFERDKWLPLYWTGLLVKYKLVFEDDTFISLSNWLETTFKYKSDTAYASFSIQLTKFLPLKSLEIQGKRPNDSNESDIKTRTYIFSETTIYSNLFFNDEDTLEVTQYKPYYQNIRPSRSGSLSGSPIIRGTSLEQKVLMKSWHDGYIAVYPSKVNYLGEERYASLTVGLANSSSTLPGVFMETELSTFTPTEKKWYYIKIPETLETTSLYYPLITYKIGDYRVNNWWDEIGSINIKHLSDFQYELDRTNISSNLQSIINDNIDEENIEIDGEIKKNYGILSIPTLSGFFQLSDTELPYDFKEGEKIPFSVVTTTNETEIVETGGSLLYNKNQQILSINKEPDFKKTKVWLYPKEDMENEIDSTYRKAECTLKILATNLFTGLEEEVSCYFIFTKNTKPIIFSEAIQIFTSLQIEKEENLFDNIEAPTSYNKELVFSQPTFILNPYEKLSYQVDSSYIYFPYLYSYGYNEDEIQCRLYEQTIEEENDSFTFSEDMTFYGYISKSENTKILHQANTSDNPIYFKSYDEYINELDTKTIKILDDQTEIKSLIYSHFIKVGLKISWYDFSIGNTFNFSDLFELKTTRLGRVLPLQFNDQNQFLSAKKIIYSLSDYGGDKTLKKNYNTTINSLMRSGNEKIEFFLYIEEKEMGVLTIESSMLTTPTLATLFLENVKREIIFPSTALDYKEGYSEDNLIEITKIIGKYYYSFNEINDYQILEFIIANVTILEEKTPTFSFRKGGVIINGDSGKMLSPVMEDNEEVGKYFVEINALGLKDRIIINFPGNISGEIYYSSSKNKIILKGFEFE